MSLSFTGTNWRAHQQVSRSTMEDSFFYTSVFQFIFIDAGLRVLSTPYDCSSYNIRCPLKPFVSRKESEVHSH